ncbi:P-loop containing nucleoside triphosphate hydrolase protein [Decorospora gaudefroyi]|uniref:P-loop containing nucleoside triphosphate hydrolase protein n=1 Tax=Decorospora gaudefroyi TaxID=184978 RepID=A0A6A5K012_9PLEO|nr:P-loop containing nucleoside triphosphate hydrolase protein [Decorospora gaudefroyi]
MSDNIANMSAPLLVGISGPSSSGKTTLSRLLRDIFPPGTLFILHLDDFYLPDAEIPVKDGVQDWDCIESLNLARLKAALQHVREHGKSPEWLVSQEDQNSVGEHGVPEEAIQRLRDQVSTCLQGKPEPEGRRICIVDGFLLFSEDMDEIRALFHVRLFLRTRYETAKRRREARSGYVTLEGFWKDPPGYVDKIVWPNYVTQHKFLFKHGDVNDELDADVCRSVRVAGMPDEAEENMTKCLAWAAGLLEGAIKAA